MERPRGFLAVWCGCFMSEASFLQVVFYRTESRILPAKVPIEGLYLIKLLPRCLMFSLNFQKAVYTR